MMTGSARRTRAQFASFALGASGFAIAMGIASPAAAQCAPDPTTVGGTTTCTGTDSDGLFVPTSRTRVVVTAGAVVLPGGNAGTIVTGGSQDVLEVAGMVAGGGQSGILVSNGAAIYVPCDPYAGASVRYCDAPYEWISPLGSATIKVTAGGVVSGTTAIRLQQRADSAASVQASVDNAGTLTATAGPALFATAGTSFGQIDNRAGGTIMGVYGTFQGINNAGVINGGNASAIFTNGSAGVVNSGQIVSDSNAATIHGETVSVNNSGTIRNNGAGPAIRSNGYLYLTNQAGGTIGAAGGVAIQGGQVSIVNAGTIDGSIVAGAGQYSGSTIDNVDGTINGGIQFGGSNDVLKARFDSATGRIAGISGAIDGGAGIDQLQLRIGADAVLGAGAMPSSFEQLSLQIANQSTVTLATAAGTSNGITATGSGRLVNTATLVTTGSAITTTYSNYGSKLDVENSGSITATPAYPGLAAVQVYPGSFTNSGTVTSIGGIGVSVDDVDGGLLTNTGTITATSTGASVSYARLVNSGIIRSTGGTGAVLFRSGYEGEAAVNSGTISGATTGVSVYSTRLENSGTISGGASGIIAEDLQLDNLASGVISGGTFAIDGRGGYSGSRIRNAGTITGNVDLAKTNQYAFSSNLFVDAGGTLNGALRMGSGNDVLAVEMGGTAGRPLAGATGGVDMGGGTDTLLSVARTTQSATIAVPSGFEAVAYEVAEGAKLTLTSPNAMSAGIGLAGTGTIDLTANVSTAGTSAIDLSAATVEELLAGRPYGAEATANPGLNVISRGTLNFTATDHWGGGCAVTAAGASFENAGTINSTRAPVSWGGPTAICSGNDVVNSGAIRIDGGLGVAGSATFVNRGALTDVAGSDGTGVYGVAMVVNSGSIVTDQIAIGTWTNIDVTNSGTIESRAAVAVELGSQSYLVNEASGTIRATEVAIRGTRSEVVNRGQIIGNVDLDSGSSPFMTLAAIAQVAAPAIPGSRYVADGGTLTGDLRFGNGDDVFVQTGATTGVTGTIYGNGGYDRIQLSTTGQGRFDGTAAGFERLDVSAGTWTLGTSPAVAETAIAGGATLIGTTTTLSGTILNGGTLRIDQNVDGSFVGTLQGDGTLVKAGTGTVTMGDQLGFTGTTSILSGRLLMSGRSASRLSIVGGTLGGTGTVAALSIGNGGTVTPGDTAIGTLTVAGDFAQTAGSTYLANIAANGQSDLILVGGRATLGQGSRLALTGTIGGIGTRYTLLSAVGGLSGSYSVVEQPNGDYQLRIRYSATSVFADVARSASGLAGLAATANQRATALGLSGLPDSNAAYAAVTLEASEAGARAALDQLAGAAHASLGTAMVQDARIVEEAALTRTLTGGSQAGLWGTMIGSRGTDDGEQDNASLRRSTFGGVGGVDFSLDGARIGLAGGYTRTSFDMGAGGSDGRAETIHLLGYGGGAIGPIQMRAGVGYAWSDNRIDRSVAFGGVSERLSADYDGNTLYSFVEAGHGFAIGGGSIQPLLGFEAYRVKTDAFTETGGSAALRGAARTDSFAFAKLGARAETPIVDGLSARANGAWLRRIEGEAPTLRQSFAAGGAVFDVIGVPLSRDAAVAGIDLVWAPSANVRIVSGYNGRIGRGSDESSFRVAASIGF